MNKVIWKSELSISSHQEILIPKDADILSIQVQDGKPCIWYLCDPKKTNV